MKVMRIEHRGGGFYGNRPPRIVRDGECVLGEADRTEGAFTPVRWDDIARPPKTKRKRGGG